MMLDRLAYDDMDQIVKSDSDQLPHNYIFSDISINNYDNKLTFSFNYSTVTDSEVVFHEVKINGENRDKLVVPKESVRMEELEDVGAIRNPEDSIIG